MEIKKITNKDSHYIDWLLQNDNHALDTDGLSGVVKILIVKINQLIDERDGKGTTDEHSGLNKPVVINRRELLLEYTKWLSNQDLSKHVITLVDEYEQSSNSL